MAGGASRLAEGIRFHQFVQYVFETQWQALRTACKEKGIRLIGDIPIFVAHDSADVWAQPDLFFLDEARPADVRGRRAAGLLQRRRASSGAIRSIAGRPTPGTATPGGSPGSERPAEAGGPDPDRPLPRLRGLLGGARQGEDRGDGPVGRRRRARRSSRPSRSEFGDLPLIAEDLGVITPDVEALRDEFDLPGMRVLQFGFDADPRPEKHLPHRFVPHCVAYTGTHDNDTTLRLVPREPRSRPPSPRAEVEAARAYRPALRRDRRASRSTGT